MRMPDPRPADPETYGRIQARPTVGSDGDRHPREANRAVDLIVQDSIRSPGRQLDRRTGDFMALRFGHDFSPVRIHTSSRAARAARAVQARAFTLGRDIVFGSGQYDPGAEQGRRLIAHELTHTIQQRHSSPANQTAQRDPQVINPLGPNPVIGSDVGEMVSLVTPDLTIIPDLLDAATLALGMTLGRPLTQPERNVLSPVFGSFLDYSLMRICSSALCSPDGIARTVGNLIATPASGISNTTLIHESAHVWQHQNGIRYAYIPSALLSQFGAWLITGSRSAAYDWRLYHNNHVPWMAWNAEAQASYIEYHRSLPPWYVWGTGGFLPVP
ncbi:MAG: DUF4157 domain-containing protein [bacterium]|nr:DUF4157 domain-containing protein [bacterium]